MAQRSLKVYSLFPYFSKCFLKQTIKIFTACFVNIFYSNSKQAIPLCPRFNLLSFIVNHNSHRCHLIPLFNFHCLLIVFCLIHYSLGLDRFFLYILPFSRYDLIYSVYIIVLQQLVLVNNAILSVFVCSAIFFQTICLQNFVLVHLGISHFQLAKSTY